MDAEQRPRRVWRYVRVLKGYRCLDCCALIEFEEQTSYFDGGLLGEKGSTPFSCFSTTPERAREAAHLHVSDLPLWKSPSVCITDKGEQDSTMPTLAADC